MLTVTPIQAFVDNYIWVISLPTSPLVYVVDPGDADVVIHYLQTHQLTLAGILITHHHHDHTGGIKRLIEYSTTMLDIFGPSRENIAHINQPITDQKQILLPALGVTASIFYLPGHTLGHIAYHIQDELFCGDTLFSGGCGRLFEGSASQLYHSLQCLANLDPKTRVYCAHEYTLSNLKFAMDVEPNNPDLAHYHAHCHRIRANDQATLPSSIEIEQDINPFLRCHKLEVITSVNQHFNQDSSDVITTFGLLRQWKDKA
ncbi:hydroxyacylglutathione hydrolase [Shewanella sp. VB17]|uniref:hydroxyacylglutathione hydrolase n=1 Tax=Shewanella sp. VB17 TaxID=2739432 RepID=UPI001563CC4A|nr:hydroxyacylglutathione hydrolase [Shewanella sp. VB17]NRD74277.1 hydroxyacylglutathione hydrolase [Shewanella sp. VB17]